MAWENLPFGYAVNRDFATDAYQVWCPAGLVTPAQMVTVTAKTMNECSGDLVRALQQTLVVSQFDLMQRNMETVPEPVIKVTPWYHRELDLD